MSIIAAEYTHFETVKTIVHTTIKEIYPHYYPAGAVKFFLSHHSDENIKAAILAGQVYLYESEGSFLATGSIVKDELCRLFVLPSYQGAGIGSELMSFLEGMIFTSYPQVKLDSSLPGYDLYIKRGYKPERYQKLLTENGDYLCYHEMVKIKK